MSRKDTSRRSRLVLRKERKSYVLLTLPLLPHITDTLSGIPSASCHQCSKCSSAWYEDQAELHPNTRRHSGKERQV